MCLIPHLQLGDSMFKFLKRKTVEGVARKGAIRVVFDERTCPKVGRGDSHSNEGSFLILD